MNLTHFTHKKEKSSKNFQETYTFIRNTQSPLVFVDKPPLTHFPPKTEGMRLEKEPLDLKKRCGGLGKWREPPSGSDHAFLRYGSEALYGNYQRWVSRSLDLPEEFADHLGLGRVRGRVDGGSICWNFFFTVRGRSHVVAGMVVFCAELRLISDLMESVMFIHINIFFFF